jgi:DNA-binding CsgD family transcriptional regulator
VAPSVDIHYPRLRELARSGASCAELARATLAYLLSVHDGNREEALSWVGVGFSWNRLINGRDLDAVVMYRSMLALLGIDDSHRAAGWCESVIREATAGGYPVSLMQALHCKSRAELQSGQLAEAEADATAALGMSQHYFPFWSPRVSAILAAILFERGQQQTAYKVIEGVDLSGILGAGIEAATRQIRGRLRCARGWRERGVGDLRAAGRLCEFHGLQNPLIDPWQASLAAALAEHSPEEARQLAQENLANARRSGIPRAIGVAFHTLGGLIHDDSVDLMRAAVATLEEAPAPLDLARALTDLGAALRRQGFRVEAREPLREALEIAARCGAVPLMERAQAEAMAAGARPRRPRLRGVDALTPSELRVARLAAEGRSNREIAQALFITVKTVTDHLGSSYSKLGVTSREKLAGVLELSNP